MHPVVSSCCRLIQIKTFIHATLSVVHGQSLPSLSRFFWSWMSILDVIFVLNSSCCHKDASMWVSCGYSYLRLEGFSSFLSSFMLPCLLLEWRGIVTALRDGFSEGSWLYRDSKYSDNALKTPAWLLLTTVL